MALDPLLAILCQGYTRKGSCSWPIGVWNVRGSPGAFAINSGTSRRAGISCSS